MSVSDTVSKSASSSIVANKSSFTPNKVSGLSLWLDSDDLSTMTINGSNQITAWNDKSGNGIDFAQSNAFFAPVMTANAFGVKSAPDFGTRTKRMKASSAALKSLDEITIFIVTRCTSSSTAQNGTSTQFVGEFLSIGNWASGAVDFGGQFIGSTINVNSMKHVSVTQQAALGANTNEMGYIADGVSNKFVATYEAGSSGSKMFRGVEQLNNSLSAGGASNSTDFSPSALGVTSNDIMLGSVINGSTQAGRSIGYIAEVLVYNRYLSTSEKLVVKNYLEGKWDVQSQVPCTHGIIGGQSNKEVEGVLKSNAPAEFTSPSYASYYSLANATNAIYVHYLDTNINVQSATEYGTEQRFARELYSQSGKPVIITKYAVGGTDIAYWTAPSGAGYGTLSARIASANNNIAGFGFRFDEVVMCIQQGESDAANEAKADAYEANLQVALDGWRAVPGLGNSMTIIMVQIPVNATTLAYRSTVRQATLNVVAANANTYSINSDALGLSDGLHWNDSAVNSIALAEVRAFLNKSNEVA